MENVQLKENKYFYENLIINIIGIIWIGLAFYKSTKIGSDDWFNYPTPFSYGIIILKFSLGALILLRLNLGRLLIIVISIYVVGGLFISMVNNFSIPTSFTYQQVLAFLYYVGLPIFYLIFFNLPTVKQIFKQNSVTISE